MPWGRKEQAAFIRLPENQMKIREWLGEISYTLQQGSLDAEVTEVVYDSRKAGPGAVFICMKGTRRDSHSAHRSNGTAGRPALPGPCRLHPVS